MEPILPAPTMTMSFMRAPAVVLSGLILTGSPAIGRVIFDVIKVEYLRFAT